MKTNWRVRTGRAVASVLRTMPLPVGKWRLANAIADRFIPSAGGPESANEREMIQVIRTAYGVRMRLDLRDDVQRRIYFSGEYDPRASRLFAHLLRSGDTVVDGGANIGYFSLLAARCVGPRGSVHAFEPVPSTFEVLQENIRLNRRATIYANRQALSSHVATLQLQMAAQSNIGTATVALNGSGPAIAAPACPLDEYAEVHDLNAIRVVKLDIEGSELSAVRGMQRLLRERRIAYLICEVNPPLLDAQGIAVDALRATLAEQGYRCYHIGPLARLRLVETALPATDADYLFVAPTAGHPAPAPPGSSSSAISCREGSEGRGC